MNEPETNGDGKRNATGYSPVHIDWNVNYWGGLVSSSTNNAVLDGDTYHNNWNYAIGDISGYYSPKTPGPFVNVGFVQLWVRVKAIKRFSCAMIKPKHQYFMFLCTFIISV
jgi:hypothetical protein